MKDLRKLLSGRFCFMFRLVCTDSILDNLNLSGVYRWIPGWGE